MPCSFCLYQGEYIVFESSQTMVDIPYGDCFTVDLRWDVRRDQEAREVENQVWRGQQGRGARGVIPPTPMSRTVSRTAFPHESYRLPP